MKSARIFGMLVMALALILPSYGQDVQIGGGKKPATNADKDKKADKKTDKKKTDKKKTKAKAKPKEEVNPEDKVAYGQVVTGTLKQIDANSQRDFTVTLMLPDAKKIFDVNVWATQNIALYQQQQLASQAQQQLSIARQTTLQGRAQATLQLQQSVAQYTVTLTQRQLQLAQKMETEIYSPKDYDLRAAEKIKVRTAVPPTEYDDKGNMKRWTVKELKNLKKGSKLPGYPAEYDALRPNQTVAVYLAKQVLPQAKNTKKGIKLEGIKLDEEKEPGSDRPEVVMIIVVQDALPGQR
jgi:hypothetical protein